MALIVNASELLTEVQFRQAWAARVKLSGGMCGSMRYRVSDSPERGKLHAEIGTYTAIGAELGSLVELATGRGPGRPLQPAAGLGRTGKCAETVA